MKVFGPMALCLGAHGASAFQVTLPMRATAPASVSASRLQSTSETTALEGIVETAKAELFSTVETLKDGYGVLIVDDKAKTQLEEAAKKLEAAGTPPNNDTEMLKGSWTLQSSTATASIMNDQTIPGIDTSKIPFFDQGPFLDFRKLLNKSLMVKQDIKSTKTSDAIDRVDHIIQYMPPDSFSDFISSIEIPDILKSLNLNPLQVSTGKFVLAHNAEVTSTVPTIQTKLSLSSVVVNVAGTSQMLDPNGADVLGVNVPLGEFLNSGSFETTYLDEDLRISRSKTGNIDQLRVFVRTDAVDQAAAEMEGEELLTENVDYSASIATETQPDDELEDMEEEDSSPSDVES